MRISEFQELIREQYYERDSDRGMPRTFMWFTEEVGELAEALGKDDREALAGEFADVFAWLVSLASLSGIELEEAIGKYAGGCPKCGGTPCGCPAHGN